MQARSGGSRGEYVYGNNLRTLFPDLCPVVDDLFLLEPHQIAGLVDRAPRNDLAIVLSANPALVRFFVTRQPSIVPFVSDLLESSRECERDIGDAADRLLWEIADLIVYQRAPAMYDDKVERLWDSAAFAEAEPLATKTVIDGGAGTGFVTFAVAPIAEVVYAVEPVATLREYIRHKARRNGLSNVFVSDGVLNLIPLPADSADVLLTHRAIGWDLASELIEIARVVRPGGVAIHLTGLPYPAGDDAPFHADLVARGYEERPYRDGESLNRKYYKRI